MLDIVQGEQHFDVAVKFYQFICEEMGRGVPWEKALLHVGKCYTTGGDPRLTPYHSEYDEKNPGTIELDLENEVVNLGGVKLNIKD